MRPGSLPALVFVLALALPGVAVFAPVAGGAASPGFAQTQVQEPPESNATTRFVVDLRPDGDARWRVTAGFDLDGENDTAAFRRLAGRFEAGTHDTAYSAAPFRQAATAASDASGRQMSIVRVNRSARIVNGTNGTGYLTLRFTWTNFSRTSGDRLYVDDAFDARTGTWLPRLGPDQTLLVRPPSGYAVLSAPKGPVNGTLRWSGPLSFDRDTLDITYERGAASPQQPPGGGLDPAMLALVVGLLVLAVAGGALWMRRSGGSAGPQTGEPTEGGATELGPGEAPVGAEAAPDQVESGPEGAGGAAEPAELLSDEERVERLLERSGGRMKQANIVEETGWSNAKVSQLLSAMEEEGRIEKLRIGRENLISLPGEMGNDGV